MTKEKASFPKVLYGGRREMMLNKTFFSKVNRSAWHKMSVISFQFKSLKRESIFSKAKVFIG